MRKVVMYCDRCKKEFEKWNHKKPEVYGIAEFVHEDGDPYLDEAKDLCESCYTELKKWWDFTPQQKMGKWIIIDDCEQFIAKCSECGRIEDSRMINKYPYCSCGAKMQGKK